MKSSPETGSLAPDPAPNWRSIPPNCTSRLDRPESCPAPGISTALLGILEGGGSLALGRAFRSPDPLVTAAGLIGLNADPELSWTLDPAVLYGEDPEL